jgi:hypothetical protein
LKLIKFEFLISLYSPDLFDLTRSPLSLEAALRFDQLRLSLGSSAFAWFSNDYVLQILFLLRSNFLC